MASGREQAAPGGGATVRQRSARAASSLLLAVLGLIVSATLAPAHSVAASPCGFQNGFGTFSGLNQPGACWRPYGDASPFNRVVPAGAPSTPDSTAIVQGLLAKGDVQQLVFGDPERDGGVPIYWSKPSDPVYTLNCTKPWKGCDLDGLQIHVPPEAVPTGGWSDTWEHDAHMTIIDQQSGWEYDMWQVWNKSGSTLNFSWGGLTRIDGDGLGSDAVSARYGSIAGPVRPEELIGGQINHALTLIVPCTNTYVFPAMQESLSCSEAGLPDSMSVPMGAHLQLQLTRKQIRRLPVPRWKKAIVRALATYGAYVSDTTGPDGAWAFEMASSTAHVASGQPDPWVQFARGLGVRPEDFNDNGHAEYWLDMASGVPWNRLRVVDECAARGSCPVVSRQSSLMARAKRCRKGLTRWDRRRDASGSRVQRTRKRWDRRCDRLLRKARRARARALQVG